MSAFNRLSIQSKLMSMLLAVSIGSIVVIAYQGYRSGRDAIRGSIENQLKSVRAGKAAQIEDYFSGLRSQVDVLGSSVTVEEAAAALNAAYPKVLDQSGSIDGKKIGSLRDYYRNEFAPRLEEGTGASANPDAYLPATISARYLQYEYIVRNPNGIGEKDQLNSANDGSDYSKVHAKYHPVFKRIVDAFGYYDLFIINNNGDIVYSTKKETDFATNLRLGPYARSSLATAFKEAQKQNSGYLAITDFSFYEPSYGQPASFAATPIYSDTELIGVLAIQIPSDEINLMMTSKGQWEDEGLGKTGETFLVGSDDPQPLLRSDSRTLLESPEAYYQTLADQQVDEENVDRIQRLETSVLSQPATSDAIERAIAGQSGVRTTTDYLGKEALSAYAPLDIRGLNWVIVSEMDSAEVFRPVETFAKRVLISAAGLVFLITLASLWLAKSFLKPVDRLTDGFKRLAKGHQDVVVEVVSNDELGELAKSFNHMVKKNKKTSQLVHQKGQETEALLLNMFPVAVAKRLKKGNHLIADEAKSVTVVFADVLHFDELTKEMKPLKAIEILNELVSALDEATEHHGVEKIKTTGSEYLAVSGLSVARLDHAKRIIDFAVEGIQIINQVNRVWNTQLQMRIGVHSGSVTAGTVGKQRLVYDVWGETVVTAHYVQSAAAPDSIYVTQAVCNSLVDMYEFEQAGNAENRGGKTIAVWRVKI